MKSGRKIVHNLKYNKTQILIKDPGFKRAVSKLKKSFADLGCPLPKSGFETEKEFEAWKSKYFEHRKKKSKHTSFYEGVLDDILLENNLDPKDKFYGDFLRAYLFFNYQEPETVPLKIRVTLNKKTKKEELYIQIFPHTSQKDIENAWKVIEKEKLQVFKDQRIRSKKWERKKADIEIYNLYERFKKMTLKERREKFADPRMEAIIQKELGGRYGSFSYELIRRAINKVKKYKNVTDIKPPKS